jgi:hypothetical protein
MRLTFYFLCLLCLVVSPSQVSADSKPESLDRAVVQGEAAYSRFCAVCHGFDGKGNDEQLVDLQHRPPDLTLITQRNGGQFPWLRLYTIINSQESVDAHGIKEMPEWNEVFDLRNWDSQDNDEFAEEIVYGRIFVLLMYLNSIQETSVSD